MDLFQLHPSTRQHHADEPWEHIEARLQSHPVALERERRAERRERCRNLVVAFAARYWRVMPWPPGPTWHSAVGRFFSDADGATIMARARLIESEDVLDVMELLCDSLIEMRTMETPPHQRENAADCTALRRE